MKNGVFVCSRVVQYRAAVGVGPEMVDQWTYQSDLWSRRAQLDSATE